MSTNMLNTVVYYIYYEIVHKVNTNTSK